MTDKLYLDAQRLLEDSWRLGSMVAKSGFSPTFIVAIWRGGVPIGVAVPYYKPSRNLTERVPDYYLYETEKWLKFPHSLEGLSDDEINEHRPELAAILKTAKVS